MITNVRPLFMVPSVNVCIYDVYAYTHTRVYGTMYSVQAYVQSLHRNFWLYSFAYAERYRPGLSLISHFFKTFQQAQAYIPYACSVTKVVVCFNLQLLQCYTNLQLTRQSHSQSSIHLEICELFSISHSRRLVSLQFYFTFTAVCSCADRLLRQHCLCISAAWHCSWRAMKSICDAYAENY